VKLAVRYRSLTHDGFEPLGQLPIERWNFMAVRVINEIPDKSVLKEEICKMCGIAIEYAPIDVRSQRVTCFDESETFRWVGCPKCKSKITVR